MVIIKVSVGKRKLLLERILSDVPETSGACVVFVGIVRGKEGKKKVDKLEYTAYTEMAKKELLELCKGVGAKYPTDAIYVHHRIGCFRPGEPTVYIAVFAPHREEAFAACKEVLEQIKARVPIWKREFVEGMGKWK
ncbi:MAG: molybdenum cofactor biosynthesis protein MoaE [Thermoplasmata archaeon]